MFFAAVNHNYDHKQRTLKHRNTQNGSKSTNHKSQTMIDGSKKPNRQLAFELQNSHVCEKRSKAQAEKWNANKGKNDALFKDGDPQNHLTCHRSRKTFPETSLTARSEYRRLYSQTTICSSGKRKLIPQNPGHKPRHGYRSIHMFLIIFTITIVTF